MVRARPPQRTRLGNRLHSAFFAETWDYHLQGHETSRYTCRPQFELTGAGQSGGTGFADLALGHFGGDGNAAAIQWENADQIPHEELPEEDAWALAPMQEKKMLGKLLENHPPLSSFAAENAVGFRGIESGADEF